MDRFEKFMFIFILSLFVCLSYAVLTTAYDIREKIEYHKDKKEMRDRRVECQAYYMDGTDNWKDCMGVGYKGGHK